MSKFTSEEALELRGTPDAIRLSLASVRRICEEHDAEEAEFYEDFPAATDNRDYPVDAGDLFAWLGY